jgi:hypothetical protein
VRYLKRGTARKSEYGFKLQICPTSFRDYLTRRIDTKLGTEGPPYIVHVVKL